VTVRKVSSWTKEDYQYKTLQIRLDSNLDYNAGDVLLIYP